MSTYSFTSNKVSSTYPRVLQIGDGIIYDGLGELVRINDVNIDNLYASYSILRSDVDNLESGITGLQGFQGFQGRQGRQGAVGQKGEGFQGSQGRQGRQGAKGSESSNSLIWDWDNTIPATKVGTFYTGGAGLGGETDLTLITTLIFNKTSQDGNALEWLRALDSLSSSTTNPTILKLSYLNDPTIWGIYTLESSTEALNTYIFSISCISGDGEFPAVLGSKFVAFSWVLSGIDGYTGSTGFQGTTGSTGIQGFQGYTGSQGFQGYQGIIGGGTGSIAMFIDSGSSVITTGEKSYVISPFDCNIVSWKVISSISGSCVIDIWKNTSIPTVANTIIGTYSKPTLSSQQINSGLSTGWTSSVSAGDIILFNVDSVSTVQKIYLYLEIQK
jgi:hypothetical protein